MLVVVVAGVTAWRLELAPFAHSEDQSSADPAPSTPSVLDDMIWVGTRGGAVYGIGDRKS
jgi:hypothetical protein